MIAPRRGSALNPDLVGLCEIPPDRVSTLITLLTQRRVAPGFLILRLSFLALRKAI